MAVGFRYRPRSIFNEPHAVPQKFRSHVSVTAFTVPRNLDDGHRAPARCRCDCLLNIIFIRGTTTTSLLKDVVFYSFKMVFFLYIFSVEPFFKN